MIKIIKITIIICTIALFYSCKDDELFFTRTSYIGNELKIDGYYYKQEEGKTFVKFLFRNGIILTCYTFSSIDLDVVEHRMLSENYYTSLKNDKSRWGVFEIKNHTIQWSAWSTSVGGGLPSFKCIGTITNDTTFHITKNINSGGQEFEKNDIYHFRQFYPKPDSTNIFIK
jgi:hypothetical protein